VSQDDHVESVRAVYDASAARYVDFVGTKLSAATEGAVDMAMLIAFSQLVANNPLAQVADVGCGPGRVAAFLAERKITVVGVDVSTALLAEARRAHPDIRFEEGRLDRLPFADSSLAGAVCWYSIIFTPAERLDDAFKELLRVLGPKAYLLLAFQSGDGEAFHRMNAHGTSLSLTSYRHNVDDVGRRLEEVGLQVHATTQRAPELDHETSWQAFIIARRR
jgi:ubiquinone/menaquinone biosynthesis C-methylase UbiE